MSSAGLASGRAGRLAPARIALLTLLVAAAVGCAPERSRDAGAGASAGGPEALLGARPGLGGRDPGAGRGGGLRQLPIKVGNRWEYTIRYQSRLQPADGPAQVTTVELPWFVEIVGEVELGGVPYFWQQEGNPLSVPPTLGPAAPVRQDANGFYSLDPLRSADDSRVAPEPDATGSRALLASLEAALARSPRAAAFRSSAARVAARLEVMGRLARLGAFAPEAAQPGETVLLQYPLEVGTRWVARELPRSLRVVEVRERVTVPAGEFSAWRVRTVAEWYGPRDHAFTWFAKDGLVRIRLHVEEEATDDAGNPAGRLVTNMEQALTRAVFGGPIKL